MGSVNDLLNELGPSSTPGPKCSVCSLLERLPAAESKALIALLSDSTIRYDRIADGMREKGIADLDRSVYAYCARGACSARRKLREKARYQK